MLTTLPPSCADCLETGSLRLLEPCGPVQACNGIALPFTLVKYLNGSEGWMELTGCGSMCYRVVMLSLLNLAVPYFLWYLFFGGGGGAWPG